MFETLKSLLEDILNGESDVTMDEFEERVEEAWDDDELSGSEYDWLIANMG